MSAQTDFKDNRMPFAEKNLRKAFSCVEKLRLLIFTLLVCVRVNMEVCLPFLYFLYLNCDIC